MFWKTIYPDFIVYLNDIIIYSTSLEKYILFLRKVLQNSGILKLQ